MAGLRAFHFTYIGDAPAETFKFYQKFIRGFLRWHRGEAVWIKGGTGGKQEAYIIVVDGLAVTVGRMLSTRLSQGGSFAIREVNPHYIIYETKELDRETVGYLTDGDIKLGDSDGINCPKDDYRRVSVQDWCWGRERGARCDAWDGHVCIYPKMTEKFAKERELIMKAESSEVLVNCPDERRFMSISECAKCKEQDSAKWKACQEFKLEV